MQSDAAWRAGRSSTRCWPGAPRAHGADAARSRNRRTAATGRDTFGSMTPPLPLVETRKVGSLTVHALQAGGQRLDGGAMFGVVPKTLWEKRIPADARNRIPLGMRCLLVEHHTGLVLIDTGAGNKENEKFIDIYGIENASAVAPG